VALGPNERVNHDFLAVALDEALVAVLYQKGELTLNCAWHAKITRYFEQVFELQTFHEVNVNIVDLVGVEALHPRKRHPSVG